MVFLLELLVTEAQVLAVQPRGVSPAVNHHAAAYGLAGLRSALKVAPYEVRVDDAQARVDHQVPLIPAL